MAFHFADDLLEAIEEKGSAPVCVGLDPVFEKLPPALQLEVKEELEHTQSLGVFCREVLQIIAPLVPAVKIQSAFFEKYGSAGVQLYEQMVDLAHDLDLLVIGDVKRNDIASTAEAYAQGHLRGMFTSFGMTRGTPDAVTINGYFGADGISPFLELASEEDKGAFVLVRTSNPSAPSVQDFADANGRKFYEHMAQLVADLGGRPEYIGSRGYSCLGAVVGATYPQEAARLREIMPQQIFLVPGYGAQGASAQDCAAAFKADGTGAIVNASRSVIYAFASGPYAGKDWKASIDQAARAFAQEIRTAIGR